MAQDQQTVTCPPRVWTQLTNADATAITFQAISRAVYIRLTTDATNPSGSTYGRMYPEGQGESEKTLADFVGVASPVRVWAKPVSQNSTALVYVDHA